MAVKRITTDQRQRRPKKRIKKPDGSIEVEAIVDPTAAITEEDDIREEEVKDKPVPRSKIPEAVIKYLEKAGQSQIIDTITEKDLEKLKDSIELMELGPSASIIRVCSVDCESYDRCPLAIINAAPIGKTCPIEKDLYKKFMHDIKEAVSEKLQDLEGIEDVENDAIIMTLISQLVEIEIMNMRANAIIASAGIVDTVPSLSSEFGVEYKLEEHVASKIKRDINNRKDKILRQLIASPEMAQKVGRARGKDKEEDRRRWALERAREIEAKIVSEGKLITDKDVDKMVK